MTHTNQLDASLHLQLKQARDAAHTLAISSHEQRQQALTAAAAAMRTNQKAILAANERDIREAEAMQLAAPLLDRLQITPERLARMAEGLEEIAAQPDLLGTISNRRRAPTGIEIAHMRVPIGIIAVIYESRPNVTADAAALCLKTGNACILHGGREAHHSNAAITDAMQQGLQQAGLPAASVQPLMDNIEASREQRHRAVEKMLGCEGRVDLVIPRGGKQLGKAISEFSKVPVLKHLEGICHTYLHADADLEMAEKLSYNAKCFRYSICCSTETLLVDNSIAATLLPRLVQGFSARGVELRGCERSVKLISDMKAATEEDWITEYLGPILSVRLVDGPEQAMQHIARYGTAHTEAIVTENQEVAQRFLREVDSSSVMHNAPTVFADGKEYGLGAEIGISTDKLHARGPIGCEGLTSLKFVVTGQGQERS